MTPKTDDPNTRYSDSGLDPSRSAFDEIVNRPDMQALNDQGDAMVQNKESLVKAEESPTHTTTGNGSDSTNIATSEENPDGFWTGKADKLQLRGSLSRLRGNRKALIAAGLAGGLIAAAIGGFLALLPLKFEMLIGAATSQASEIPEHAIENRLQYLTQYYIAQRILGQAHGQDIDVSSGSIIAGTFSAWKAAGYERKLGFTIESDRLKPGEKAFSWRLRDLDGKPLRVDGKLVGGTSIAGPDGTREIVSQLNGNKEFTSFLKVKVKESTHWHQFYKRYSMRKTLMRKYGVSRWAWLPEAASDKLDTYAERKREFTRDLRQKMRDNTIGRIMPKSANYMNCLTEGGTSCEELKDIGDQTNAQIEAQQDTRACGGDTGLSCDEVDRNNQVYAEAASQNSVNINNTQGAINDIDIDNADSKTISKLVSKQVLAKLVGGVGIIDTIFRAVDGVENGALNQVMYDRNATAYIGYSSEILAINDQMKAGELDIAQLGAVMEVVGDFGASPAWQETTGIIDNKTSAKNSYERDCPSDDEGEKTTLPKGELVCMDRKVVHEKNPFEGQSWWEGLANVASAYMSSVGGAFGWVTDKIGALTNVLGLDDLMKALGLTDLIAKGMEALVNAVYGAPITGLEHGPDAGDNVIAGIQSSYFALGQTGQDLGDSGDGGGLGIGGAVMSRSQTAALKQQIATEKSEEVQRKSLFAKLFDTEAPESALSQAVFRTPTSIQGLASLPTILASSINSLFVPQTSATGTGNNAFGFNFSYGFTDAELVADPEKYNEESCQQLHDAREESYGKIDEYPIMVYTKSDPCALEKVVAASGQSFAVDGPPQYFDLFSMNGTSALGGGSEFNIASFNVLGASHSDADYQARMDRSIKVLNDNAIDIVGFQEFQAKQRTYFKQQIGSKYDVFDKKSNLDRTSGGEGVNSIGWDKNKFRLVTGGYMPNLKYFGGGTLEAPWIKLQDIATEQQFYVLNTHDPAHPENADLRLQNAKQHVDFVTTLKKEGLPVFFTGDFNSGYSVRMPGEAGNTTVGNDPQNLAYCILTKGGFMHDAYDLGENRDVKCPNPGNDNSVDHVFLTDGPEVTRYWKIQGGKTKNGSDVHDTHIAAVTIPAAVTGGDWPGGELRIASYNMRVGSSEAWHEASTSNMKNNNFDVVGMQEISSARMFRDIAGRLRSKGYETYPKTVNDNDDEADIQARAIAYRTEKFEFLKADEVTFTRMGTNRDQPAHTPVVWLKDKGTGQIIVVLNTHNSAGGSRGLTADDGFPYNGPEQRFKAAQAYVEKLSAIQAEGFPLFVIGDFNEGYGPGIQGSNNYQQLFHCMARSKNLVKAVEIRNPEEYCKNGGRSGPIDHLYASPQVKVDKFGALTGSSDQLGTDHRRAPYADLVIPKTATGGGAIVGDWAWPVDKKWWQANRSDFLGSHIGTGTAWGADNMGTTHKGAGIASDIGDPPDGSPVYAMLGGVVTSTNLCGSNDGIAIKSKLGNDTIGIAYMHGTAKKFNVGDTVRAGERIMSVGTIGCNVSGGHVHIGIAYNGKYVCPQDVFLAIGSGKAPDMNALVSKAAAPCGR